MADVTDAQGARLRRNGTLIASVRSIGEVGIGRALRDVTTLSDTVHKHKLNIPDLPEIPIEIYYDPQEPLHRTILLDEVNGALQPWQIDIEQGNSPEENVSLGNCYVFGASVGPYEVDGDLVLKFNLKPQSLPVGMFDQ